MRKTMITIFAPMLAGIALMCEGQDLPTRPRAFVEATSTHDLSGVLRQYYQPDPEHSHEQLVKEIEALLKSLEISPKVKKDALPACVRPVDGSGGGPSAVLDLDHAIYRIVTLDPSSRELLSFHYAKGRDPYDGNLLLETGNQALCQILLKAAASGTLVTTYAFAKEENPLLAQLPEVIKSIDPTLLLGFLAQSVNIRDQTQPSTVATRTWAEIGEVPRPIVPAKVQIKEVLTLPKSPDVQSIKEEALKLTSHFTARHALYCAEAGALSGEVGKSILAVDCTKGGPPGCWDLLTKSVTSAYQAICPNAITAQDRGELSKRPCWDSACAPALLEVDRDFRALVEEPEPEEIKGEFELSLYKKQRLGFSILTSAITGSQNADDRAKLDQGALVADPLTGAVGLTILNIHPMAFDSRRETMSMAERVRLFIGAAVVPHLGPAAGIGFAPFGKLRGVSLNTGVALLYVDKLPEGKAFGDSSDRLRRGWAKAWLVGISYKFGS